MKSLSSVGLGLSVVFGCLFLALATEVYYLLWWKRRINGREIEDDYSNPAREIFYISCWKSKKQRVSLRSATLSSQELIITADNQAHQSEIGFQHRTNKDLLLRPFDENCIESGLMMGPPRFLFTIKEETKEDLESEDGKSKGESRRLSDLMRNGDTPYMTPLSSPAFFTPPLTPSMDSPHSRSSSSGYNPLYESSTNVEFNRMRFSPPPKFKFLRDAEEKLQRKNTMEEAKGESSMSHSSANSTNNTTNSKLQKGEEDGSFITIIVANKKDIRQPSHQYHSPQCQSGSSSQVLPLAFSPFSSEPSLPNDSS